MNKFYEKSQSMSRFLTKTEERITENHLLEELISAASLDPENMKVGAVHIPDKETKRPVVVGEHALSRSGKRLGLDTGEVLHMAINALNNPFVGKEVVKHPVFWDDEKGITAFYEDGLTSTVLVDEQSRYTLVFEAGFNYILLKTVWDNCFGAFRTSKNNVVITIDKNGAHTRRIGGRAN